MLASKQMELRRCRRMLLGATVVAMVALGACNAKTGGPGDPVCGNGRIEGIEACDANNLLGQTCRTLGYAGGQLACNATCTLFDTSGCSGSCGNGIVESGEVCDGNSLGGETCQTRGFTAGQLACGASCTSFDTSACTGGNPRCGDGIANGTEDCDGADLGGGSCFTEGFATGTLQCTPGCAYDTSGCSGSATCGDGFLDTGEECDGFDLGGMTCADVGFASGRLGCQSDCSFDTSGCFATAGCGDGAVNVAGEICDGADTGGRTCVDEGFTAGALVCNATCDGYDTSLCMNLANTCGNGVLEVGEACDGADLGGATCAAFGGSGTLSCTAGCALDFSSCTGGDLCAAYFYYGDGYCDPCEWYGGTYDPDCSGCGADGACVDYVDGLTSYGPSCQIVTGARDPDCGSCGNTTADQNEICDGSSQVATCADIGFASGTIGCTNDCVWDASNCVPAVCGDSTVEGAESCDGSNLAGSTCNSLGFLTGPLACDENCRFDTTACTYSATCGNGVADSGESCDGSDFSGRDCVSINFGFAGGTLGCTVGCQLDMSGCTLPDCGNGVREVFEQCDDGNLVGSDGCDGNCDLETAVNETEPNDNTTDASSNGPITQSTLYEGTFSALGDHDWYAVTVPGPSSQIFAVTQGAGGDQCGSVGNIDTEIEILEPDGVTTVLASDDIDANNYCSRVLATGLPAGTYYVRVSASQSFCVIGCTFPMPYGVAIGVN